MAAAADPPIPVDSNDSYFLRLDGIPGDSTVNDYVNQIEGAGWMWGVSTSAAPTAGAGGGGAGKSKPIDFTFAAFSSIASPPIFLAVAQGKHLRFAILAVVRPGDSSSRPSGCARQRDPHVVRTVQLRHRRPPRRCRQVDYAKVTYIANIQNVDGGIGDTVTTSFNFITNKAG
jgi:hypothetical protein